MVLCLIFYIDKGLSYETSKNVFENFDEMKICVRSKCPTFIESKWRDIIAQYIQVYMNSICERLKKHHHMDTGNFMIYKNGPHTTQLIKNVFPTEVPIKNKLLNKLAHCLTNILVS